MPLSTQIANTLYDGSYAIIDGIELDTNIGAEVDSVRPIANNTGYVNIVWSARFVLSPTGLARGYYDSKLSKGLPCLGWYEVRYGVTVMGRYPIDALSVGTPKITGVYDGATVNSPGDTYVVGNGATLVSVNIGSDRPYRGDTLVYYVEPGISGTLYVAVNTGFIDNLTDANKYIIHP